MILFELKKIIKQKMTIVVSLLLIVVLILCHGDFPMAVLYPYWSLNNLGAYVDSENSILEMERLIEETDDKGLQEIYKQQLNQFQVYADLSLSEYFEMLLNSIYDNNSSLSLDLDIDDYQNVKFITYLKENIHSLDELKEIYNSINYIFYNNDGTLNMDPYGQGNLSVIRSLFYSGFFILPIFIIIICFLSFHMNEQFSYLLPKKRYMSTIYKIIACVIYSFIAMIIAFGFVYLYYGLKNGFGSFNTPIIIAFGEKYSNYKYADFDYISIGLYLLLCFLILLLYTCFLVLFVFFINRFLKSSIVTLIISIACILGFYYLVYQRFALMDSHYLSAFTYSNPVLTLFGKTWVYGAFSSYKPEDVFSYVLGKQLEWKYGIPSDVYFGSAFKIVGISSVILFLGNCWAYRKMDVMK